MKRLLVLLLLVPFIVSASEMDIVRADFEVTVGENRQLMVSETLVYDFHVPSHGIVREIPLNGMSIDIVNANVESLFTSDSTTAYIRLGSEDELVDGIQEYHIVYTLDPGRDRNEGYDEIYLDFFATADESADNITFSLALPKKMEDGLISATYGPYGATDALETNLVDGRIVTGELDHLDPWSALTLRVELEDGYFYWTDHSVAGLVIASLVTAILLGLFLFLYFRYGRDEEPVIVPTFSPPDDLSPLEIGYLYDSKDDVRDYVSMVYYWADRGLLTVEEKEKGGFILHKVKDIDEATPDYEKRLFEAFFRSEKDVDLDDINLYDEVERNVRPLLRNHFSKGSFNLYDNFSRKLNTVCLCLTLLYSLAMSLCLSVNDLRFTLFAFFSLAFQFAFCAMIFYTLNRKLSRGGRHVGSVVAALVVSAVSFLFVHGISISAGLDRGLVRAISIMTVLGVTVLSALSCAMPRRSAYAQKILGQIFGYRDFLENVEVDKLKALIDQDPQYFYHNLSYSIVLDLEDEWVGKAEGLFREPAGWYVGPGDIISFQIYSSMARRMNNAFMRSVMVNPHSSAHSSFGSFGGSHSGSSGFAGGGMGGGGASRW